MRYNYVRKAFIDGNSTKVKYWFYCRTLICHFIYISHDCTSGSLCIMIGTAVLSSPYLIALCVTLLCPALSIDWLIDWFIGPFRACRDHQLTNVGLWYCTPVVDYAALWGNLRPIPRADFELFEKCVGINIWCNMRHSRVII